MWVRGLLARLCLASPGTKHPLAEAIVGAPVGTAHDYTISTAHHAGFETLTNIAWQSIRNGVGNSVGQLLLQFVEVALGRLRS